MPRAGWSLLLIVGLLLSAPARAADGDVCAEAIRAVERSSRLPRGLLGAVSFAESGRRDPDRPRAVAWPWTVNNAGDGRYFGSKAEAIAHVEALRAAGKRNIDVGCMQINLMHHPDAFASLELAFEPMANVGYGARFLQGLERETGSWARAIERYHTADPARGQAYRARVVDRWQDVRLADAAGEQPGRRAAVSRGEREPSRSAGLGDAPTILPGRGQLAAPSNRGFISLIPSRAKVTVLRPQRGRPIVGKVGTDGRIAGSLLRLGPRRSRLGQAAAAKAPGAAPPVPPARAG